ncbi:MAG: 8-amino-7-oxononanoate synthase [Planctomycetaceae bacterium]|nr:8-amino-7-oxononanoate synthase [Planctomycetaceae bacterium]
MPRENGECEIDGRRLINFASNDYLGLAGDERLRQAAQQVLDACGTGAAASALICGRSPWHERLEEKLASFEGTEAALLFPTGYAANVGAIAALVGRGDAVFSDALNHASLIDGCRLSRAEVCVFPHRDVDRLAEQLKQQRGARRRLIVTDGIFSMDGDPAPLIELAELAERFDAMLLVDEAHATGVLGESGRGTCAHYGVESSHLVRVGTLSKGLGTLGGFVAGSSELIEYLWNRARTQVFSTALPPALCAAALCALEIAQNEPQRRRHVCHLSVQLRRALVNLDVPVPIDGDVPIIPIILGGAERAVRISASLARDGLLVPAIRPPTVPQGTSRLRISLSAAHSPDVVDVLARRISDAVHMADGAD